MPTKLPAFQFYPGDWMKDPALRSCSLAARGIWMDLLCLMFECDRRGFLQAPTGKPYSNDQLARMTGCALDEITNLLQELEAAGVYSRTNHGIIFSRRLKRDEEARAENRKRQNMFRNSKKTQENSNASVTHEVTPMSHPSSSSVSSSVSKKGTGATTLSTITFPVNPETGEELAAANWLLEELCVPADNATRRIAAESIRLLAKAEGTVQTAADFILQAGLADKAEGIAITRFWFSDQKYQMYKARVPVAPKSQYRIEADQQIEDRRQAMREAGIQ